VPVAALLASSPARRRGHRSHEHESIFAAGIAVNTQEAVREDAAVEELAPSRTVSSGRRGA
jgi:hypothetical protein